MGAAEQFDTVVKGALAVVGFLVAFYTFLKVRTEHKIKVLQLEQLERESDREAESFDRAPVPYLTLTPTPADVQFHGGAFWAWLNHPVGLLALAAGILGLAWYFLAQGVERVGQLEEEHELLSSASQRNDSLKHSNTVLVEQFVAASSACAEQCSLLDSVCRPDGLIGRETAVCVSVRENCKKCQSSLQHARLRFGRLVKNEPNADLRRLYIEVARQIDDVGRRNIVFDSVDAGAADSSADARSSPDSGGQPPRQDPQERLVPPPAPDEIPSKHDAASAPDAAPPKKPHRLEDFQVGGTLAEMRCLDHCRGPSAAACERRCHSRSVLRCFETCLEGARRCEQLLDAGEAGARQCARGSAQCESRCLRGFLQSTPY